MFWEFDKLNQSIMKELNNLSQKKWIFTLGVMAGTFLLFDMASDAYIKHQNKRDQIQVINTSFQETSSSKCFNFFEGKIYRTTKAQ